MGGGGGAVVGGGGGGGGAVVGGGGGGGGGDVTGGGEMIGGGGGGEGVPSATGGAFRRRSDGGTRLAGNAGRSGAGATAGNVTVLDTVDVVRRVLAVARSLFTDEPGGSAFTATDEPRGGLAEVTTTNNNASVNTAHTAPTTCRRRKRVSRRTSARFTQARR